MPLTPTNQDALAHLMQPAFARASAALSTLLGQPIELHAPDVRVLRLNELPAFLATGLNGELINIHMTVEGALKGAAALLFSAQSAAEFIHLLTGQRASPQSLTISQREALHEVGNILLNACLGHLGNQLGAKLTYNLPHLDIDNLGMLLAHFPAATHKNRRVILARSVFQLKIGSASGYIIIILDKASLNRLLSSNSPL